MPDDIATLRHVSARLGCDPLLVQAAGGNTSLKRDGTMWIKASGTWLANAERDDIFVAVRMAPLLDAVARVDPLAETAQSFVVEGIGPAGLRPSIETTVHALMPQPAVIHVHCVETIAWAVRPDAESALEEPLAGLDWAFIPYVRPGLPLALEIEKRRQPRTRVLVLGKHGLVTTGETVAEAEALVADVASRLCIVPRPAPAADLGGLEAMAKGSGYRPAADPRAHATALDTKSLALATGGSLYPDHVIFLGPGAHVVGSNETVAEAAARAERAIGKPPPLLLVPGKGALLRQDAGEAALALACCLAEVTTRVDPGAVAYLTAEDEHQLTHWDAEKYRQALEARRRKA